jgi:hypothetical protein
MDDQIKDTWPRFFAHYGAAVLGYLLRVTLPTFKAWIEDPLSEALLPPVVPLLLLAAGVPLIAGGLNSNLPAKPRELSKSLLFGFALNIITLLPKG